MTRTLFALAITLIAASPAAAGWNNVFQVCCNDCSPRRSYYVAPAPAADCPPDPCPQPEVRTSYVQRCYYQPVTEYRRESYYVPVKENVKSYYYEPVTSYRYTSYYDPCTGCCQEMAVPTTSYRVREQCNSVTRWVEKSRSVPVTSYRPVTTYQPVVTYYYPPSTSMYLPRTAPGLAPPRVDELRTNPPAVMDKPGDTIIPKPNLPTTTEDMSMPRAMPKAKTSAGFAWTASRRTGSIRGEVVQNDRTTPRPGAKIVFVNAKNTEDRKGVTADAFGGFDVTLPAGEWYVYLGTGTGRADLYKKTPISVREADDRDVTLVSR